MNKLIDRLGGRANIDWGSMDRFLTFDPSPAFPGPQKKKKERTLEQRRGKMFDIKAHGKKLAAGRRALPPPQQLIRPSWAGREPLPAPSSVGRGGDGGLGDEYGWASGFNSRRSDTTALGNSNSNSRRNLEPGPWATDPQRWGAAAGLEADERRRREGVVAAEQRYSFGPDGRPTGHFSPYLQQYVKAGGQLVLAGTTAQAAGVPAEDEAELMQRQLARAQQIVRMLRKAIAGRKTLLGVELTDPMTAFRAIDTDNSGTVVPMTADVPIVDRCSIAVRMGTEGA
jgi:hypothetical protein